MTDEELQTLNKINGTEAPDHSVLVVVVVVIILVAAGIALRVLFPPAGEYKYKDD